ncbi:MAG TPA: glycosyltransferase family 1 protein [Vicinamibacterales bacterium]|nr:glycosyltransferase family 1 protein [Vicinamibacterales bacterium]
MRTVSDHFPGIGRFVLGLGQALAALGPVTLLHGERADPRLPLGAAAGLRCVPGPFTVRQQWEVPRLLRAAGARVYHSPYYLMPYRPGVPAVVTCFDLIPLVVPGVFDRGRRFAFGLAHRLAFQAAAVVCVPSEATRADVARFFPWAAAKLQIVRPGAPFAARASQPPRTIPTRFVLHVGSNKTHKDLDVLVEAWGRALEAAPAATSNTALVLVGPRDRRHPEPARSIARLGPSGRVIDRGPVPDAELSGLYAGASLFICPSRREGFGLPLLEAMGCGLPCICSDTAALLETAGGAAMVYPAGDAGALAAAIVRLLSDRDEAARLSDLASARASAFDWRTTARDMAAVYALAAAPAAAKAAV